MKISALIPAYNEEKHLASNLKILSQLKAIKEIIVINDASTDQTAKIAHSFTKVKVFNNSTNLGKTASVIMGAKLATHNDVLLYDADLFGMRLPYLQELITTYQAGYDMVIMDKGGKIDWYRKIFKATAAQSGTRLLKKQKLLSPDYDPSRSFDLEPKLNEYFLSKGFSIAVTAAPTVNDLRKFVKYPFFTGLILDLKAVLSIILTYGIFGIPKTFRIFRTINSLRNF